MLGLISHQLLTISNKLLITKKLGAGDTRNLLTGENKNTNNRRSVPNANLNTTWYGIYSPSPVAESRDRVFTDIAEATVESKKLNARFQVLFSIFCISCSMISIRISSPSFA